MHPNDKKQTNPVVNEKEKGEAFARFTFSLWLVLCFHFYHRLHLPAGLIFFCSNTHTHLCSCVTDNHLSPVKLKLYAECFVQLCREYERPCHVLSKAEGLRLNMQNELRPDRADVTLRASLKLRQHFYCTHPHSNPFHFLF